MKKIEKKDEQRSLGGCGGRCVSCCSSSLSLFSCVCVFVFVRSPLTCQNSLSLAVPLSPTHSCVSLLCLLACEASSLTRSLTHEGSRRLTHSLARKGLLTHPLTYHLPSLTRSRPPSLGSSRALQCRVRAGERDPGKRTFCGSTHSCCGFRHQLQV